ncbi:hypothetical protein ACHAXR_013379 [Thalassiosira sp. AJA248-18]
MTSDSATAAAESTSSSAAVPAAAQDGEPLPKIDPITAVQDSIDSLALSLFEALRGVRDAVAPESLEVPGAATSNNNPTTALLSAFKEEVEEMENKDAYAAKDRLLHGLNIDYFPPRAFDLLEPDYDSFLLAYLSDNPYAKELVERFNALDGSKSDDKKPQTSATTTMTTTSTSTTNTKDMADDSAKVKLGDVGYEFRKKFDSGWYTGKVTEIRPLAANGYDRRCIYSDGDIEDLSLQDLELLATLDPNYEKPKPISDSTDAPKSTNSGAASLAKFPLTQAEYAKLLINSEHQRDVQTTQVLAQDILAKSAAVDDLVAELPGMSRTRQMQMERINELIKRNHDVTRDLEDAYVVAKGRREEVRVALEESTSLALGVEEDS